jgi:hypothetical protein
VGCSWFPIYCKAWVLLVKVAVTDGPFRQRQLRGKVSPTGAVCSINRARKSHSFGGTGKVSKKEKSKKIRGFFKERSLMNAQELEHLLGELDSDQGQMQSTSATIEEAKAYEASVSGART